MLRFALCLLLACAFAVPSCDECDVHRGPCPEILLGEASISGDLRIDGIFAAVVAFMERFDWMRTEHETDLRVLAELYDVDLDLPLDELTVEVRAAIEADLATHVTGGLHVAHSPLLCTADTVDALEAYANCIGRQGCNLTLPCGDGLGPFACDGRCHGSCSGSCSRCAEQVDGECSGVCAGACFLAAGGTCDGVCIGQCAGECALSEPDGQCHGLCSGTCTGSCLMPGGGDCGGECCGECVSESSPDGACDDRCVGTCDGECVGRCAGLVTATCPGDCEEAAGCTDQATARAALGWRCELGSIDVLFEFDSSVSTADRGCFEVRFGKVKEVVVRAQRRHEELRWLVQGAPDLGLPAAVDVVLGMVESLIEGEWQELYSVEDESPCMTPALEDSFEILAGAPDWTAEFIQAHIELLSILGVD